MGEENIPKPEFEPKPLLVEGKEQPVVLKGALSHAESIEPSPSSKTPEDVDFESAIHKKTQEYENKVEKLSKKFTSQGSIGENKGQLLVDRQINRFRNSEAHHIQAFHSLSKESKAQRREIMLAQAGQELEKIYQPFEEIIDYARGLDKLDDQELARLEALMDAMAKLKTNPELENLFKKALTKQPFSKQDFQKLASKINPVDLNQEIKNGQGQQLFEATQVGAVISLLLPAQRLELVDTLLETKSAQDSAEIINVLVVSQVISLSQLQALCNSGKISEPYKSQFLLQMDQGELNQQRQVYEQMQNRLTAINKGRTAEPALSKTVGSPMLLAFSALWGAAVMAVNFKTNFDFSKPGESIGRVLSSPMFLLGTAAAVGGSIGVASIADPARYNKVKEGVKDFFGGPEDKRTRMDANDQQIREYLEIPFKSNPYIIDFLTTAEEFPDGSKKSGFQILQGIVNEQKAKKQPVIFKLADIAKKCQPKQQKLLEKALGVEGGKDLQGEGMQQFHLIDKIKSVMACCSHLGINTEEDFHKLIVQFQEKEGLKKLK